MYGFVDASGWNAFVNDSYLYLELAENLRVSGRFVYQDAAGTVLPDFTRTPVYPVLIAGALELASGAVEKAVVLMLWLQRFLWGCSVCFLLPSVRGGTGHWRGLALLGKVLLLFSPVVILHASLLMTDMLYVAGLMLGVRLLRWAFWRDGRNGSAGRRRFAVGVWWIGLLHGMLTLVRPIHVLVPMLLAIPWVRCRIKKVTVFLLLSSLLPAVWMARNYRLGQPFTLASIGGINLAVHQTRPLLDMAPAEFEADPEARQFVEIMQNHYDRRAYAANSALVQNGVSVPDVDAIAGRAARITVWARPGSYIAETLRNLRRLVWSPSDTGELLRRLHPKVSPGMERLAGLAGAAWGAIFFFALPGVLLFRRVPRRLRWSHLAVSYYLAAAFLAFVPALTGITYGRFALPLLPFIGMVYAFSSVRIRRTPRQ